MSLIYSTGGGRKKRYYKIKRKISNGKISGDVTRISCQEYDDSRTHEISSPMSTEEHSLSHLLQLLKLKCTFLNFLREKC